jgi:hypothetical protein
MPTTQDRESRPCQTEAQDGNNISGYIPVVQRPIPNYPGVHIPYRDSKLTKLLADSLAGNGVTLMVGRLIRYSGVYMYIRQDNHNPPPPPPMGRTEYNLLLCMYLVGLACLNIYVDMLMMACRKRLNISLLKYFICRISQPRPANDVTFRLFYLRTLSF